MNTRIQARVVTYDPSKKAILLVRNNGRKFWCAPGGGLENGEDIRQCAAREVLEETGIHVDVKRMLYAQELHDEKTVIMEFFWLAELSHEQALNKNHQDTDLDEGVEEARWFTKEELQDVIVYPTRLCDTFWDNIDRVYEGEDPFIGVIE